MEQNEPSTGELIEALRCDGVIKPCEGCFFAFQIENCAAMGCRTDDMFGLAADRLESQERELSGITGELERFRAFHERYAEQTSKKYVEDICALTARAEQAEADVKKFAHTSHTCAYKANKTCFVADDDHEHCAKCEQWKYRGLPQEGEDDSLSYGYERVEAENLTEG
jgi:hypothetical protein